MSGSARRRARARRRCCRRACCGCCCDGVAPDAILCLTFTKAGAAEMAERIHERLALWVRMDDVDLRADLNALGADVHMPGTSTMRVRCSPRVLDSAPGAIRVQTIHSFCQTLLASFPARSGDRAGLSRRWKKREATELQRAGARRAARRGGQRWRYDARRGGDVVAASGAGSRDGVSRALCPSLCGAVSDTHPAAACA